MTHLPPTILDFESVEQLDQLPRDLGWPLEYRQLQAGAFSSSWSVFEDESFFLLEERSMRSVEISAGAMDGMVVLAVIIDGGSVVNGRAVETTDVIVQTPGSDFLAVLPAGTRVTQVAIPEAQFEAMIEMLAPDLSIPMGQVHILPAAPGRSMNLHHALYEAILSPSARAAIRDENISAIAANFISALSECSDVGRGQGLKRLAALRVLERARNYIEAHAEQVIRIESLCSYAGTTMRTLERIFSSELGVTPKQYVKARRLNAARRCLLDADREQGIKVTDVALDHGFSHLGRFSGEYRRYFGESPLETLIGH